MKNNISVNIKLLRKKNNISQEELAKKIHITPQAISKWETGKSLPDSLTLKLLSEIFNISIDELMSENMKPFTRDIQIIEEKNDDIKIEKEANFKNWIGYISFTINFFWILILSNFFLYEHSFIQYIILVLCYLGLFFLFLIIDSRYMKQKKSLKVCFIILNIIFFIFLTIFFYLPSLN